MNSHRSGFFFCIFLFTSLFTKTFAQSSYVPFPEGEAIWHVTFQQDGYPDAFDQYMYKGDTFLNGYYYHKLYYSYEFLGQVYNWGYVGYLRQDSSQKKIFYFSIGNIQEQLLYDFNLQLGDLYPHTFNHFNNDSLFVYKIDSISLNGSYRKRYSLLPPTFFHDTLAIIEGVGSTGGLRDCMCPYYWESNNFLTCVQADGETIYTREGNDDHCEILGVNESNAFEIKNHILSNLIREGEKFTIVNSTASGLEASVFDIFGNLILKKNFIQSSAAEISSEELANGIYFIKILADNKYLTVQKLVVQ